MLTDCKLNGLRPLLNEESFMRSLLGFKAALFTPCDWYAPVPDPNTEGVVVVVEVEGPGVGAGALLTSSLVGAREGAGVGATTGAATGAGAGLGIGRPADNHATALSISPLLSILPEPNL